MFFKYKIRWLWLTLSLVTHTLQQESDIHTSENFVIQSCGPHANTVKDFLGEIHNDLQSIIASMDSNSAVYKAFLTGVKPESVKDLLHKVMTGSSAFVYGSYQRPTIRCVINERSYNWDWCQRTGLGGSWIWYTATITLCPKWLTLHTIPRPYASECGKVSPTGTELMANLAGTQYGCFLHELLHIYMGMGHLNPEVYDMRACMALPGRDAFRNPMNLVLYVTNVKAGCTRFPVRVAQQPDRDLLEAGSNQHNDVPTL